MAQPTPYDRQFSFQDFQAQEPTTPLPGDEVDGEFNAVKLTIDQTLVNLAKIQRDDGALKNGIVTNDSLSDSLSIGFTYRGSWASGVNYLISDGASVGSIFYKAKSSHLSSGANQPPNATYWDAIADFTPLAIGVDSVGTAAIQDSAVTEPKHAAGGVSTRALADGALAASASGLAKMADGYLSADAGGLAKMADGYLSADAGGLAKMADGYLAASTAGRAKMADGFTTSGKLAGLGFGQCRLVKSGANIVLQTLKGNLLTINGANQTIPSAGVSLAPTGLTPGTLYYIYAYMNSGTMTLEASTTGHSADTATGVEIKTGDATRSFVGWAYVITGPAFVDTDAQRLVASWFNPRPISGSARFSAIRTTTSTSYTEINSEIRVAFIARGNSATIFGVNGGTYNSGANQTLTSIGIDGNTPQDVVAFGSGASAQSTCITHAAVLSEGYHFATIVGRVSSGTGNWYVSADSAGERFTLKVATDG